MRPEGLFPKPLAGCAMVTEQYPDLKANQNYNKTMELCRPLKTWCAPAA
jgi:LemA protein